MKRLDWQLVRPPRPGAEDIDSLERRIDAFVARASETLLSDDDLEQLIELEDLHETQTVPACEAVSAPRVEDDPDWETRAVDEFADSDTELELEEFLDRRRSEPDCDRCPYASPYSVFPMDPCEFSAGPLLYLLDDPLLHAKIIEPMDRATMGGLADALEQAIADDRWAEVPELDGLDYLHKTIFFLRFWARHGFTVRAIAFDDEPPVLTPDGPVGGPGESSEPSPVLH